MAASLGLVASVIMGQGAGLITQLTQINGDTDRPVAQYTGQTVNILGGPANYTVPVYGQGVRGMTDRLHVHVGASADVQLPDYLVGREYVMIANNNRDNPTFRLDVSLAQTCVVYLLVDNRIGDGNAGTPPTLTTAMSWILRDGWLPVQTGQNRFGNADLPDETGIDESADGSVNNWNSVYSKVIEAGQPAFSTYEMNDGRNMYALVIDSTSPPVAPTNLGVILSGDQLVRLSWERSAGASSYQVKRALTHGGPYEVIASGLTASTYDDTAVQNGKSYYYVVSGSNDHGESSDSAEAVGKPNNSPQGVGAIGGRHQITVSWTALPGAVSYSVSRSGTSGGPYTVVGENVKATSFVDGGLSGGETYYYVVTAALPAGPGGASAEVSAYTAAGTPVVTVEIFSTTALRVSWVPTGSVVTGFHVEQSSDGQTFTEVAALEGNVRDYVASGLELSSTSYFRVTAVNDAGASEASLVISGTTPDWGINVNFANASFTQGVTGYPLPGFLDDYGAIFEDRGNGFVYGWDVDNAANARQRNSVNSLDRRYDTLNHLQKPLPAGRVWEIELPEGLYAVRVVGGDPDNVDSVFQYLVEGVQTDKKAAGLGGPNYINNFIDTIVQVSVADGRLTLENGPEASNNKVAFIDIYHVPAIVSAVLNDSKMEITWTGGGRLQATHSLTPPVQWQDAGGGGFYTAPVGAGFRAYRVLR